MNRILAKCFSAQARRFSTQAKPSSIDIPGHSYGHQLPRLLTTPPQPTDMITSLPLVSYLDNLELDVPQELFLDLRLATCPVMSREAIHTTLPNLRVHSLRTSMLQNYKNDTYVSHLNNTNHPSPYHLVRLQEEANELNCHNINQRYLWSYWYEDKCFKEDKGYMSCSQMVKHSRYSEKVEVQDYIPLLHSLGCRLFNEGPNDIRRYLKDLGFITGRFYDAEEFADKLKLYFNNHDV